MCRLHPLAFPISRGWEPGDAELEEAMLAVQLLAELAPARHLLAAAPQLTEAAYRLSARWAPLPLLCGACLSLCRRCTYPSQSAWACSC